MDTIPTLTVDAGNFATTAIDAEATPRREILMSFYERENYDAITLGEMELNNPIDTWIAARDNGMPIIAANLFKGKRSKKPLFEPYRWYERGGVRMSVVGLIPERAAMKSPDSLDINVKSPFEMQKLMRKLHKRSDQMTVIGDFTPDEAKSLVMAYPFIDVIISSSQTVFRTEKIGRTILAACGSKGYYGDYVQLAVERDDSSNVETVRETLDIKIPADSTYEKEIARTGIKARK